MALVSGKRCSEIHAWTNKGTRFTNKYSKVMLNPDAKFIAKNQLARELVEGIKTVVIPALVDTDLLQDRSTCPVRALRYYLHHTKDMRSDKHKLFISYRPNFSQDIVRCTISTWLKQTIIMAHQNISDNQAQILSVKAHDLQDSSIMGLNQGCNSLCQPVTGNLITCLQTSKTLV